MVRLYSNFQQPYSEGALLSAPPKIFGNTMFY